MVEFSQELTEQYKETFQKNVASGLGGIKTESLNEVIEACNLDASNYNVQSYINKCKESEKTIIKESEFFEFIKNPKNVASTIKKNTTNQNSCTIYI